MKNRLSDLNNHLFAQLERLSEEDLDAEKLEQEVKRADAIVDVSQQIIQNANLQLKAATLVASHGDRFKAMLPILGGPPPSSPPAIASSAGDEQLSTAQPN